MKTSNVLTIKSTLLLRSIISFSITLTTIGIALFFSIQLPPNLVLIIAGITVGTGIIAFLTLYIIKEDIEDKNTSNMISWSQKNYGIRVNRKQAIELVRYGNAEFGNENHMIQLSLVERNGNFSLHKTQETKILKEME
jgi:hypothetical protein